MEFRVLRYFLAVAREGNITKAADVMHVSQPALSMQLKQLEDELGKKLFIRSSHCISLTEEGLLLKKRAEDIVCLLINNFAPVNNLLSIHDETFRSGYVGK